MQNVKCNTESDLFGDKGLKFRAGPFWTGLFGVEAILVGTISSGASLVAS